MCLEQISSRGNLQIFYSSAHYIATVVNQENLTDWIKRELPRDRSKGNGHKLEHVKLQLNIRAKKEFTTWVVSH